MQRNLHIEIADLSVSIEGDTGWDLPSAYRPFVSAERGTNISLYLKRKSHAELGTEKVFDCRPIWTLYRNNGTFIFQIFDELPGLQRTLILTPEFQEANLYFADKSHRFVDPFFGPTMELLMLNYLAAERGVIIHGCGVAWNGRGILFVGESGAGKSTMARRWDQEPGAVVLSDDRTVVRKRGPEFWIYGTPWHGDAAFGSPRGVPLETIFFLKHGRENSVEEIRGSHAVSQLFTCSFPPLWDPQGMEFVLGVFTELTGQVPCRKLRFRPDRSAVEFVNGLESYVG
jgi:hypothetical protein